MYENVELSPTDGVLVSLLPMLAQGRTYSLVEPGVMGSKEFLQVGNKLNTDGGCPVKLFRLGDGWGLVWGYEFRETVDWLVERFKGLDGFPEGLDDVAVRLRQKELNAASTVAPVDGGKVGLFNVGDGRTAFTGGESFPSWGISYTDIAFGKIKPWGMDTTEWKRNQSNVTTLLKSAKVNDGGDCVVFEWCLG